MAVGGVVVALFGQLLAGTAVAGTKAAAPGEAPDIRPITWGSCAWSGGTGGFECGVIEVPADWAEPSGPAVEVAVVRHRAGDPERRIGALLLNPGGPGASGVDFARGAATTFSPEITARFDLVGFDPRGIGRSTPVRCDGDLVNARRALLQPQDEAGLAALRQANRDVSDSCRELSGPLADHMDTASVVRDMDAIRAALGERRISYYGASYGTLIGQQYAERYPRRLRAMVLDSNMDHSLDARGLLRTRAETLEGAFGQFAEWCGRTAGCALRGRDVPALYDSFYRRAEAGELALPNPHRPVTVQTLRSITFSHMYNPADWYSFATILASMDEGTAGTDTVPDSALTAAAAGTPVTFPYSPVLCQDYDLDMPSYATMAGLQQELAQLAPLTRLPSLGWSDLTGCQNWTPRVANPQRPLHIEGAPPILLANSRWDVATPHAWAANAARQIGREAVSLTYEGVGHGVYWLSPCARGAIDTYLTTLDTTSLATHCPPAWPGATSTSSTDNPLPTPLTGPPAARAEGVIP
ncbi:alpha/beta fold hydrolase [Streptomyces paludis]|uniref:Alpha/beta fold hydrolase n=1 Tax=Streptomyces paludis TaxID=2282738 RepID=A0A345I018_9ACTN|nr:alpha/beta fold hydrolase [Streptomyces paludis]